MKIPIFIISEKFTKTFSIFIDIYAITLFPFIISKEQLNEEVKNHESIHIHQQKELFLIFFYLLYVLFFTINYFKFRDTKLAYLKIPFEVEAYKNQEDLEYLKNRKFYSWIKYINND